MERYAVYFMPAAGSDLGAFGASVIGRDAETGAAVRPLPRLAETFETWSAMTAAPRRYGFHATLKAPFRLTDGAREADVLAAATAFAETHHPIALPPLQVARLGRFLALTESAASSAVSDFAAAVVRAFDPLRAPLSAEDRAIRLAAPLSARQIELLDAWGYPHVLDQFRFHMTLTGPLPDADAARAKAVLTELFESVAQPDSIEALTIAKQSAPDAHFLVLDRLPLRG
ncbi:MAG: DUF1045 domain-containing protein [Pseudomonadota bacterium]